MIVGLSSFQGNPMTIKYARRAKNERKLSYAEIKVLRRKGDREKLEKYGVIPTKEERKMWKEKKIADKEVFERINNRHRKQNWSSVQEKTNDISLKCLRFNKK